MKRLENWHRYSFRFLDIPLQPLWNILPTSRLPFSCGEVFSFHCLMPGLILTPNSAIFYLLQKKLSCFFCWLLVDIFCYTIKSFGFSFSIVSYKTYQSVKFQHLPYFHVLLIIWFIMFFKDILGRWLGDFYPQLVSHVKTTLSRQKKMIPRHQKKMSRSIAYQLYSIR